MYIAISIDFEHNQTRNHPQNAKILQDWKSVLDTNGTEPGKEKALIITADDDLNATLAYIEAGITMVRMNLLSGNGASLAERIENKLKEADFKKSGWMVSIEIFGFKFVVQTSVIVMISSVKAFF